MDKDCIVVEIGSNKLFYGFYESIYSNSDEFIDDEFEIKDKLTECITNNDIKFSVEYQYLNDNYMKYKKSVCKCFRDKYCELIIDNLPSEIIDDDDFLFEIVNDDDNIVISSPKYYNYTTDKPYWLIITNEYSLKLIKDYVLGLDGSEQYIIDNHSSYDGFISFIKNDIEYWKSMSISDMIYEERYLIALLDMFIFLSNDRDILFDLNYDVYDNTCKYCFTDIVVCVSYNIYTMFDVFTVKYREFLLDDFINEFNIVGFEL